MLILKRQAQRGTEAAAQRCEASLGKLEPAARAGPLEPCLRSGCSVLDQPLIRCSKSLTQDRPGRLNRRAGLCLSVFLYSCWCNYLPSFGEGGFTEPIGSASAWKSTTQASPVAGSGPWLLFLLHLGKLHISPPGDCKGTRPGEGS